MMHKFDQNSRELARSSAGLAAHPRRQARRGAAAARGVRARQGLRRRQWSQRRRGGGGAGQCGSRAASARAETVRRGIFGSRMTSVQVGGGRITFY
jgi:hypothetical protein